MSLVPPALSSRNSIYGLAIIVFLLVGISVAIGTGNSSAADATATPTANVSPTAVASVAPSPPVGPSPNPSVVPSPSPIGTLPPGTRDLSQYENGGALTLPSGASENIREAVLSQARTFLLRKWNTRQPGRLSLTTTNLVGRPETRHFFVERNGTANWKITLEMAETEPGEFFFVEEIGIDAKGRPIFEPRPGGPQAVSRGLHLKLTAQTRSGLVF